MGRGLDLVYGVGLTLTSPVWGCKLLRTGKWRTDWAGRFGHLHADAEKRSDEASGIHLCPTVLIHAVSVGETSLIAGLVDRLTDQRPDLSIVIAATTNTGYERSVKLYGGKPKVTVVRYPLDFTSAVNRFLDTIRPDVVASVELEVWPNFTATCDRRGIPVAVINGRLSERSFRGYSKIRRLLRPTFARLAAVAAQTPDYAKRFVAMGVPADRVQVFDTMKWDTAKIQPREEVQGADELAADFGIDRSKPVVVAGSTGTGEEKQLIDCLAHWPAGTQLVLVPRKPERFNEVAKLRGDIVRRTAQTPGPGPVYLVDTMGELRKAYALADVAIVGRSFNGWGGSDPIEPVALGLPTIVGPDHHNFADAVAALSGPGGLVVTRDPAHAVNDLLSDPNKARSLAQAGREVIVSRQGSTCRHADLILDMLPPRH